MMIMQLPPFANMLFLFLQAVTFLFLLQGYLVALLMANCVPVFNRYDVCVNLLLRTFQSIVHIWE